MQVFHNEDAAMLFVEFITGYLVLPFVRAVVYDHIEPFQQPALCSVSGMACDSGVLNLPLENVDSVNRGVREKVSPHP